MSDRDRPGFWERWNLITDTDLPPTAKLLLTVLNGFAGDRGRAFPSQAALARKCSVSPETVRRLLRDLRRRGLIDAQPHGRVNQYRIRWNKLAATPGASNRCPEPIPGASDRGTPVTSDRCRGTTPGASDRHNTSFLTLQENPSRNGVSMKPTGGRIAPEEFGQRDRAHERLVEAVAKGWIADTQDDRLWYLASWVHCHRRHRAGEIKSPGAVLTHIIQTGDRSRPTADDEAEARRWIADRRHADRPALARLIDTTKDGHDDADAA